MNKLDTSNYHKLVIRSYPNKYFMKKYDEEYKLLIDKTIDDKIKSTKYLKIFNKHIDIMRGFKWDMIEHITGFNQNDWYNIYMYDAIECAYEYIWESTDIIIVNDEGRFYIYIPKEYQEYYEWILDNIPDSLKYNILKRSRIPWFYEDKKNCKITRSRSIEMSKSFLKRIKKVQ